MAAARAAAGGERSAGRSRSGRRRPLNKETDNAFTDVRLLGAGAALAGATAWTKTSAMGLPDAPSWKSPDMQPPMFPTSGPGLPAGRHAQRLDAAASHEQRRQGVSSCRRAGRARDGARHDGVSVGLQRPVARSDDRGGRRRPRPHLRHQQAARAHDHPLARHDPAKRHGWRGRTDPAGISRPARPSSTSSTS